MAYELFSKSRKLNTGGGGVPNNGKEKGGGEELESYSTKNKREGRLLVTSD